MSVEEQIVELYQSLDEELNNFSSGERFYPVRTLMERYKTNKRVIDGTLTKMETNGLIVRTPRVGIFANVTRLAKSHNILLVMPDWPSPGLNVLVESIRAEIAKRKNYRLQVQFNDPNLDFVKFKNDKKYDAVLLDYPAPHGLKKEDLARLMDENVPVVLLGQPPTALPLSSLAGDDIQAGMLACNYLITHGCKKLAVVIGELENIEIMMRTRSFCSFAEMHGIPVRQIHANLGLAESSSQKAYDALLADMEQRGVTFDGLFVLCDAAVPGVYSALREWNMSVPEDVSVIGHDGYKEGVFFAPPLTTIAHDEKLRCKILFDKLDEIFTGKIKLFKEVFPGMVLERESVKK